MQHHLKQYMLIAEFRESDSKELPSLLNGIELVAVGKLELFLFNIELNL